jgi:hypothetical protein
MLITQNFPREVQRLIDLAIRKDIRQVIEGGVLCAPTSWAERIKVGLRWGFSFRTAGRGSLEIRQVQHKLGLGLRHLYYCSGEAQNILISNYNRLMIPEQGSTDLILRALPIRRPLFLLRLPTRQNGFRLKLLLSTDKLNLIKKLQLL